MIPSIHVHVHHVHVHVCLIETSSMENQYSTGMSLASIGFWPENGRLRSSVNNAPAHRAPNVTNSFSNSERHYKNKRKEGETINIQK